MAHPWLHYLGLGSTGCSTDPRDMWPLFSMMHTHEASATSSFNAGGGFAALFARPEDSHWTFGTARSAREELR